MICCGIDAGSRLIKVLLLEPASGHVLAADSTDQGIHQDALAEGLLADLLTRAGLTRRDVARTVATGYGRASVSTADTTVTEITCHAVGVHHLVPQARTVIEIGGQDSKFLSLQPDGSVRDFAMNDRCAAGTGRFLEMVAKRLELSLDQLGELARASLSPAPISSMCVVFAETEIIGLLAEGARLADIIAGVQKSIVTRVAAMAGRNVTPPVVLTGGVAMVPGMAAALEAALGVPVALAPDPRMTGALGAALLAARGRL
ncbi:MAG: acyl-CoA dehydratase activase [Planctomycetota bacterium]